MRKPTVDGRTELIFTSLQLLERLAHLVTPPRVHKHRYCGVLAPNAHLPPHPAAALAVSIMGPAPAR